jgi:hypothetical protein
MPFERPQGQEHHRAFLQARVDLVRAQELQPVPVEILGRPVL